MWNFLRRPGCGTTAGQSTKDTRVTGTGGNNYAAYSPVSKYVIKPCIGAGTYIKATVG